MEGGRYLDNGSDKTVNEARVSEIIIIGAIPFVLLRRPEAHGN